MLWYPVWPMYLILGVNLRDVRKCRWFEMSCMQYKGRTKHQTEKCINSSCNLDAALISNSKAVNSDKTFIVAEVLDKTTYSSPSSSSLQQFVRYISWFLCFSSFLVNRFHSFFWADVCLRFSSQHRLAPRGGASCDWESQHVNCQHIPSIWGEFLSGNL